MAGAGGVDGNGDDDHLGGRGWSGPDADDTPLDLDSARLPPWADRRVVRIEPGDTLDYHAEDWHDSFLVVVAGAIELESPLGSVHPFALGSMLWCQGLPIRLIRSTGTAAAVLISISRRPRPP